MQFEQQKQKINLPVELQVGEVFEGKYSKTVENIQKYDIIKTNERHGAYTDKDDPRGEKREQIAQEYYEQVLNRNRTFEIKAVAKNTGFTEEDVDKIFAHVFELEHLFEDGRIGRFDPDYYMQHSWMRLRAGKNIQPHDITLLNHELAEANIMGNGLDVVYEDAHNEVEKIYNYAKELREYLKTHDA